MVILGLIIRAGQVMATIVCFKEQSPKWLKICGGIGSILFMLALIGLSME